MITNTHIPLIPLPNVQPQLARVQPRIHANHNQPNRDNHGPQLHIQHIHVEVGPHRRHHGRQQQRIQQIPAPAMILPHALGILDAAIQRRDAPHGKADDILQQQHDARRDAQVAVHGVEVAGGPLLDLVGLDEQHAGGEEQEGEQVEGGVGARAELLVLGAGGGLEDEDGFGQGEDAQGLEQRVRAEERDEGRLAEDAGEDVGDEEERAGLGEPAGALGGRMSVLHVCVWGWTGSFEEVERGGHTSVEVLIHWIVRLLQHIAGVTE